MRTWSTAATMSPTCTFAAASSAAPAGPLKRPTSLRTPRSARQLLVPEIQTPQIRTGEPTGLDRGAIRDAQSVGQGLAASTAENSGVMPGCKRDGNKIRSPGVLFPTSRLRRCDPLRASPQPQSKRFAAAFERGGVKQPPTMCTWTLPQLL